MHRFLSPDSNFRTKSITITDPAEVHHLATVLRLKKGSEIAVFNGRGEEATGRIENLAPHSVEITIVSPVKRSSTAQVTLTLACAIPKKAKFEFIIEKCTELGVDRIIPMLTERTEVRLNEERQEKKRKRYETVAANAAKQCKRSFVPVIEELRTFKEIISNISPQDAAFIPCLAGERKNILNAFQLKTGQKNVLLLIGPEGDFTPKELQAALGAGCIPVTLGPHTLKVDTAAVTAIAAVKLLLEKSS